MLCECCGKVAIVEGKVCRYCVRIVNENLKLAKEGRMKCQSEGVRVKVAYRSGKMEPGRDM